MIYKDPPEIIWPSDKYYLEIFIGSSVVEWQKARFELFLQNSNLEKQIMVSKKNKLESKVCYLKFYFKSLKVILHV